MLTELEKQALDAEFYSKAAQVVRKVVKAGETVVVDAYGCSLFLISATGNAPLLISTDATGEVPISSGNGQDFPRYFRFKTITLKNTSSFDVAFVLWYGFGKYVNNTFYLSANPSYPLPVVSTQLAATSGVALSGVPPLNALRRRSVIVTNRDPSNWLEIYDKAPASGGVSVASVPPNALIEYDSDAPLYVYNPGAAAVQCRVSETWLKL